MAKQSGGGGKRQTGISGLSVVELEAEISRRQRRVNALQKRRDRLLSRLESIDAEITDLGGLGRTRGGRRIRPRNEMNLVEALHKTLEGKTMSVTEVAEAVQRGGYKTTSPSFRTIVNQALIASGKFKRVGRGQYTSI